MPDSTIGYLVMKCPHCQADNEMTVDGIDMNETIGCSRCHKPLGLWKDIRRPEADDRIPAA